MPIWSDGLLARRPGSSLCHPLRRAESPSLQMGIDELTGLPTYDALPLAVKEPAAAVFFDVDALRRVTNEQGHLASDDVLKKIAE